MRTLLIDGENAKLVANVAHPVKFWNELNVRFIGTRNKFEMKIILKVMILVYANHYSIIRDLNTMLFWIKCLVNPEYLSCRYLIL